MGGLVKAVVSPITSLLGAGGGSAPAVKPPAPMPDANAAEALAEKRRRIATQQVRSGRLSTMLSEGDGGGQYSSSTLG